MRTGAIFARGSCRALKWLALVGMVLALGAGQAAAQITLVETPTRFTEGEPTTVEVKFAGDIQANRPASILTLSVAAGTGEGEITGSPMTVTLPAGGTDGAEVDETRSFTVTPASDRDAQDGTLTLTFTLDAAGELVDDGTTTAVTGPAALTALPVDDDEMQSYAFNVLTRDTNLLEGQLIEVRIEADPPFATDPSPGETVNLRLDPALQIGGDDLVSGSATTAGQAQVLFDATTDAPVINFTVAEDTNNDDTPVELTAFWGERIGGGDTTARIIVRDNNPAEPPAALTFATQQGPISVPAGATITPMQLPMVTSGEGTPPYMYSATGLPAGLSVAEATGMLSGTPTTATAAGGVTVTYTAMDSGTPARTGMQTFTVTVTTGTTPPTTGTGTLSGGEFTFEFESNRDDPKPMEGGQMSLRVVLEAEVAANTSTPTTVDVIVSGMAFDPPDSRTTPAEDGDWTLNDVQSNTDGNRLTYALVFPANPTNRSVERTVMTSLFELQTRNHDADAEDEALRLMASLGSRDGGLTGLSESQELTIDDDEDQYYNFTPNPGSGTEGGTVTGTLTAVPKHVQGWEELTLVLRDEADDSPGENNPPRVSDYRLSVNRVELGRSNSDADNRATVTITAPDNDGDRNDDALRLTAYTRTEPDRPADDPALWEGGRGGWLVNVGDAHKLPRLTATLTDSTGDAVTGSVVTEGMNYTLTLNVGGAAAEDLRVVLETAGSASRVDDFSLPTTPIVIAEGEMSSGPITLEVDRDEVVNDEDSLEISALVNGEDRMYGPPQDGLNPVSLLSLTIRDDTDKLVDVAPGAEAAIQAAITAAKARGRDDGKLNRWETIHIEKSDLFVAAPGYVVRVDGSSSEPDVAQTSDQNFNSNNVEVAEVRVFLYRPGTATITITGTAASAASSVVEIETDNLSPDVAEITFDITVELAAPAMPDGLAADVSVPGQVTLNWDGTVDGRDAYDEAETYEWEMDASEDWKPTDTTSSHTVSGLTNGTRYTFRVRAKNSAGVSEGARVQATPMATPVDASQVVTVKSVSAATSVAESGGLEVTVVANVPAGTKGADGKVAPIASKRVMVSFPTTDIVAAEKAEASDTTLLGATNGGYTWEKITRTEEKSEQTYKFRVAIGQDLDAEDEKFLVEVMIDGASMKSKVVTIDDAQEQKYVLSLPTANKGAITEGKSAKLTLKADPKRTIDIPVTLAMEPNDPSRYTLSTANGTFGTTAFETTVSTKADSDRADDTLTVTAYTDRHGEFASLDITVKDANALPAVKATLVDKDGKALDPQPESVMEGETVKVMLTAVDKDGKNMKAAEKLTITLMPTGTADAQDYRLSSQSIEIAKDKESSAAVDLMITEDQDIGEETLMFDAAVSGEAKNGTEKRSVAGVLSLMITDGTQMLVWANSEADVQAAVYAARDAGAGDDMTFTAGETIEVMGALLFSSAEGVSVSYSAASSMSGVASASVSGGTVMVTAVAEGMADITITAHASMSSGVKILDQTDPGMASIMFPVEVGLEALSITLSGPEDDNLTEGMSAMVTAKANRPVSADTKVMLMRDRAMSTASDADYTAEAITIAAGMDTGSTMVMAVEDNMAEDMEELVLYGMTEGMAGEVTGEVHLHLWDAAVPALPVIAQLLLAALMAVGGYRRYRRR